MPGWRHSITLRLSLAFALLATVVFAALGLYFSRAADEHMAELDAHELFGKLALIGHIGMQEKTPEAFAARLGDALIGQTLDALELPALARVAERQGDARGASARCAAASKPKPAPAMYSPPSPGCAPDRKSVV